MYTPEDKKVKEVQKTGISKKLVSVLFILVPAVIIIVYCLILLFVLNGGGGYSFYLKLINGLAIITRTIAPTILGSSFIVFIFLMIKKFMTNDNKKVMRSWISVTIAFFIGGLILFFGGTFGLKNLSVDGLPPIDSSNYRPI